MLVRVGVNVACCIIAVPFEDATLKSSSPSCYFMPFFLQVAILCLCRHRCFCRNEISATYNIDGKKIVAVFKGFLGDKGEWGGVLLLWMKIYISVLVIPWNFNVFVHQFVGRMKIQMWPCKSAESGFSVMAYSRVYCPPDIDEWSRRLHAGRRAF